TKSYSNRAQIGISKKVIPLWRPQTAGPPEHFVVFGRKIPRTPLSTKIISDSDTNGRGLPESFEVIPVKENWMRDIYDSRGRIIPIEVKRERDVLVDGTGLRGSQYTIRALKSVTLTETMFLNTKFGTNIFAITAEKLALSTGQLSTLVIIHRESM
ncbi:hypothetical protein ABK731_25150, partial [Citrobacter freundii]